VGCIEQDEQQDAVFLQDIIDRNIKRASDKSQADYQEIIYEAYAPGGPD
jgi:transcriptional/translational regulatory protein YebC/TACO1